MLSLLLSALAVSAAPHAARQQNAGGYLIQANEGASAGQFCLATLGSAADGTIVGFVPCGQVQTTNPSGNNYAAWSIQYGNQLSVQLIGTNYCLDAGTNPGSDENVQAKVWTCYPGLEQQQFYYTGTNHIAVTGSTPCLSIYYDGTVFNPCGPTGQSQGQQDFTILPVPGSMASSAASSVAVSSTFSSAAASSTSSAPPPASTGKPIYWANGNDISQCLTVTNGQFYDGSPVGIAPCANSPGQMWVYSDPGVTSVQVAGQNYCIDFGTGGGSDGTPMKIWTCYSGLFQQTMYYTNTNHIAVYNGNQCLDVEAGTSNVQSWACSGPDVHQHWLPAAN